MVLNKEIITCLLCLVISVVLWGLARNGHGNNLISVCLCLVGSFKKLYRTFFFALSPSSNSKSGLTPALVSETPDFPQNKYQPALFYCKSKRALARVLSLKSGVFSFIKSNRPDFCALLSGSVQKAGFLLGIFVFLSFSAIQAATKTSTGTGGNWSAAATWVGGVVPAAGDDVTIAAGASVTIDINPTVGSLLISGTLEFEATAARSITVLTQVTISSTGVFRSAQSGTVKNHRLIVEGSIINDGIIDFSSNSNATGAEIVFTGSGNAIFNCSDAPLTNLRQTNGIILNKGTSAGSVLSFTPGNTFQVLSNGSSGAKGFFSILNGTFNIIGSNNFSNPVFNTEGDYTIPATGGFWLGNQNATVIGMNGTVTNLGDLKITNGTYNVGVLGENSLETIADGQFKMSGGTLNVAGNFIMDSGNAAISGGKINLATQANSADQVPTLSMSGRTSLELYGTPVITIVHPNSKTVPSNDIQIELGSGRKLVTGGAIQLGTEATPAGRSFFVNGDPVINRLTVLNECTIQVFNTSKSDLAVTPISSLPIIAFDKIAPELTAPPKLTIQCGENLPKAYASLQEFTNAGGAATDNCTLVPASFKLVGQVQSSANCPYTITRTYQISDASGNIGTAQHLIVVEGEGIGPEPEAIAESPAKEELKLKSAMAGATITAIKTGLWSDPTTWDLNRIPLFDDDVKTATYTVTVNAAAVCNDITIETGGTLNYSGANTLQVYGDWTNSGTYNGGTNGIVEFVGATSTTINGTTNFEELIINKGSLASTLTINGPTTVTSGGSLIMTSGLVTIPSGKSLTVYPHNDVIIEKPAGFDLTGGTLTTDYFSITNKGLIRISAGTANFGNGSGNSVHTQIDGAFIVSGGSVNIAGRLENTASGTLAPGIPSGISISGGAITLSTVGNGLSSTGSLDVTANGNFVFTGGTVVFQNESTATTALDLGLTGGSGTKTTIGGTFQFGNASTPGGTVFNISSSVPLSNVTSFPNADLMLINDITIGNWALDAGTTIDLNGKNLQLSISNSGTNYTFPIVNGTNSATLALNFSGISTPGSVTLASTGTLQTGFLLNSGTVTTPIYITANTVVFSTVSGSYQLPTGFTASQKVGLFNNSWSYQPAAASVNFSGWTNLTNATFVRADCIPPTVSAPAFVCVGGQITLSPTTGGTWTSSNNTFATVTNAGVVTGVSAGNVTFTFTETETGCSNTTSLVTVNPLPTPTLTSSDADNTFCAGTSVTFNAGGGTNYNFRVAGSSVQNGGSTTYTTSALTNTQVVDVIVTNAAGCTATSSTITNTVNPLPTASIAGTTPVCQNATAPNITFTGVAGTAPYTFTYKINNGSTQTVNTTIGNSVTVSAPTATSGIFAYNLVSVSDANSCQQNQSGTATITVNPTPTVTSPGNQTYCSGLATTAISLTGTPSGVTFDISGGAGVGLADQTVPASIPVFTPIAGTATVTITPKASGCTGTPIEFLVTVNSMPVISSCPSPISVSAVAGTCSATATYTVSATGLPAANYTYTFTGATSGSGSGTGTGSSFNVGTTIVKVTASNTCGSVECTFTVTITDNEKPVVTCLGAITQNVDAGTCGKVVTYTAPVGTDNCSGATTTQIAGLASGATFPVGITTNTFRVTDAAGNTNTCSFTVTITDNEAPVISGCPASTIVNTGPGRTTCNQTATWTEPTATDACNGVLTFSTRSHAPGALFNVGTTTVTYTFKDTSGNTSTCTFAVTMIDNTPPTFIVPAATTISTDVNCNIDKTPAQTGSPINLFDNCTAPLILANNVSISDGGNVPVSAACTSSYTFTRSWGVTDAAGNTTTQTQLITVVDNVAPQITVPNDVAIQCGTVTSTANTGGTASATDNCGGIVSITFTDSTPVGGTCDKSFTRTWKATDACGNFQTGTQFIRITDTEKPTASISSITVRCAKEITDNHKPYTSLAQFLADGGTVSDNCSTALSFAFWDEVAEGLEDESGYCPDALIRTYRITDECGNYKDVIQTITNLDNNNCKCSLCETNNSFEVIDLRGNPGGSITRTVRKQDKCCDAKQKNDYCASFNVIIDDDAVGITIAITNPSPPGQDWKQDCKSIPGGSIVCLEPGRFHLFTFCKNGNGEPQQWNDYTFTSVQGVVASDDITTRINCAGQINTEGNFTNPIWQSISPGDPGEYNKYLYATATSTVAGSGWNVADPFFKAPPGAPEEIQYSICGNIPGFTCSKNGAVINSDCDTITVYVKPEIKLSLNINPDLVCEGYIPTITPTVVPAAPQGTYVLDWTDPDGNTTRADSYTPPKKGPYTVTITDVLSGVLCNTGTATFTIEYDDEGPDFLVTEPPLRIQCNAADYVSTINTWRSKFQANYINLQGNTVTATVTDDFNFSKLNMFCNNVVTVTFSTLDQCNNNRSVTSTITVYDDIKPVITHCPADAQNFADNNLCLITTLVMADPLTFTDNCGTASLTWVKSGATTGSGTGQVTQPFNVGITTVTYTVTDACGNAVSCTQRVTIIDNQPPTITCPQSVTVTAPPPACELQVITIGAPTIGDNCSTVTLTWTKTGATTGSGAGDVNNTLFQAGITTVTYTVTDAYGNSASCSFTVTVNDQVPPTVITCPADVVDTSLTDLCVSGLTTILTPTATDPCGVVVSITHNSPYATNSSTTNASGIYPVGTTTITWFITDNAGNVSTCTQLVTVTDRQLPTLSCPGNVSYAADTGFEYKTNVDIAIPSFLDNCPGVVLTWTMGGATTNTSTNTTGVSYIGYPAAYPLLNVGINTITYTITDASGQSMSCTFAITITSKPEITCPTDLIGTTDTGTCTWSVNSGVPTLNQGAQPITWNWTITGPTGVVEATGTSMNTPTMNDYNFNLGTSIITWTATNSSGSATCSHTVTVTDNIPPTFTPPDPFSGCVQDIIQAVYNGSVPQGDPLDVTYLRPDYYTFVSGDPGLDLDPTKFLDNCGTMSCTVEIRWTITLKDGTLIPAAPTPYLTGQPSTYGSDITFLCDPTNITVHTITYWIVDCAGNVSDPISQPITIHPRPYFLIQH